MMPRHDKHEYYGGRPSDHPSNKLSNLFGFHEYSELPEVASVFVRPDHIASSIVNTDHSIM